MVGLSLHDHTENKTLRQNSGLHDIAVIRHMLDRTYCPPLLTTSGLGESPRYAPVRGNLVRLEMVSSG